jgi:hypothetical protein
MFNKRIMVYDERGTFVGDTHWSGDAELEPGEEIELDRGGIIVQVSDLLGKRDQDLSVLLVKPAKQRTANHDQIFRRPVLSAVTPNIAVRPSSARPAITYPVSRGVERPAKRQRVDTSPSASTSKRHYAQGLFGTTLSLSGGLPSSNWPSSPASSAADDSVSRAPQGERRSVEANIQEPERMPKSAASATTLSRSGRHDEAPLRSSERASGAEKPLASRNVGNNAQIREGRVRAIVDHQSAGSLPRILAQPDGKQGFVEVTNKEPMAADRLQTTKVPRNGPPAQARSLQRTKDLPVPRKDSGTDSHRNAFPAHQDGRANTDEMAVDADPVRPARSTSTEREQVAAEPRTKLRIKSSSKRGLLMLSVERTGAKLPREVTGSNTAAELSLGKAHETHPCRAEAEAVEPDGVFGSDTLGSAMTVTDRPTSRDCEEVSVPPRSHVRQDQRSEDMPPRVTPTANNATSRPSERNTALGDVPRTAEDCIARQKQIGEPHGARDTTIASTDTPLADISMASNAQSEPVTNAARPVDQAKKPRLTKLGSKSTRSREMVGLDPAGFEALEARTSLAMSTAGLSRTLSASSISLEQLQPVQPITQQRQQPELPRPISSTDHASPERPTEAHSTAAVQDVQPPQDTDLAAGSLDKRAVVMPEATTNQVRDARVTTTGDVMSAMPTTLKPTHEARAEEQVRATVAALGFSKPCVVNPATRGRKAATKSDAAGQMPQDVLPPDLNSAPQRAPATGGNKEPRRKMAFPGFTMLRVAGPWSREAHDLLESGRPTA